MITEAGSEPVPAASAQAVIRTGCADRSGRGQSQHRMGLGCGGPHPLRREMLRVPPARRPRPE